MGNSELKYTINQAGLKFNNVHSFHDLDELILNLVSENNSLQQVVRSMEAVEDENNSLIHDLMERIQYLEGKLEGYQECMQAKNTKINYTSMNVSKDETCGLK